MVSVAISLAVLSALIYVYVGSRGAYRTNEALARVQERGRFALEWISRDLRRPATWLPVARRADPVYSYDKDKGGPPISGLGSAIYGFEKPTRRPTAPTSFRRRRRSTT